MPYSQKFSPFFPPAFVSFPILMITLMIRSCVATFTALTKIYSTEYTCNAKAMLDEILCTENFHIYSMQLTLENYWKVGGEGQKPLILFSPPPHIHVASRSLVRVPSGWPPWRSGRSTRQRHTSYGHCTPFSPPAPPSSHRVTTMSTLRSRRTSY